MVCLAKFLSFEMNIIMRNEIEIPTFVLALANHAIRRTSSFEYKSGNPAYSAIQFHDDLPENRIPGAVMRQNSLGLEGILVVCVVVRMDRFFGEIWYGENKFVTVHMGEIFC